MFGVGVLVTVVSCYRLAAICRIESTTNPTWDMYPAALWSGVEIWVGIICACLPTARIFVTRMLPKWLGLSYAKSVNQYDQQPQTLRKRRQNPSKYRFSWKANIDSRLTIIDAAKGPTHFVQLTNVDGSGQLGFEKPYRPWLQSQQASTHRTAIVTQQEKSRSLTSRFGTIIKYCSPWFYIAYGKLSHKTIDTKPDRYHLMIWSCNFNLRDEV